MSAIVLAAGSGRRLGINLPKTLISIDENTLLSRILHGLQKYNIKQIKIITGFQSHLIEKSIKELENVNQLNIEYIYNSLFNERGSFYSLFMGIKNITDGAWVFDSDIIFEESLFEAIVRYDTKYSALCSSDLTLNEDKVMIVKDSKKVLNIGKNISIPSSAEFQSTEYIGVAYLNSEAINLMKLASPEMFNLEYEQVINKLLSEIPFLDLSLGDFKWNEVDTKCDLEQVRKIWGHL